MALITHFAIAYNLGLVQWSKNYSKIQKNINPIIPIAIERARRELFSCLISKESHLLLQDENTKLYVHRIGLGLFSNKSYRKNDCIAEFNGIIRTMKIYRTNYVRVGNNKGGYAIHLNNNIVLDCYSNCKGGTCMASLSNCPQNCFDISKNKLATSNARISIDHRTKRVRLMCDVKRIHIGEEILWDYGEDYIYPTNN